MNESLKWNRRQILWLVGAFALGALVIGGIAFMLLNIQQRKDEALVYPLNVVEISETELNPEVWGKNYPREYSSWLKTQQDDAPTAYGGSQPFDKLERFPVLKRLWAGYAFSVDYSEERGHYYALIDQKETGRQDAVKQPGACANCHAAEAPQLIQQMGWEKFNVTPYKEISSTLHYGSSCADCHDPKTMDLRITRPALVNALTQQGVDWTKATRQEMRTLVCAQCHVEYYFQGDNKLLTFPWSQGTTIDAIEKHYDAYGFKDFANKETGAPMIKIQHPEYEMFTTGIHYKSGVSCADCHMPYQREGAIKVSDHWIRSPLTNVRASCGQCHKQDDDALKQRIVDIQETTASLLRRTENALTSAMDAIVAAKNAGATDEQLTNPRELIRKAQMRWDFVFSENSTGFHSPQEAARILGEAIDYARQAQIEAEKLTRTASQ
jgi:nitrite reductase (cytochrome c-552)